MTATAIVVAAGSGTRLGKERPKALVEVGGVPLLVLAIRALTRSKAISAVVAVVPAAERSLCERVIEAHGPWNCPVRLTDGGAERQDSVRAGLAMAGDAELVAVHDAARPFIAVPVIDQVVNAARQHGAAIVATPASDTVKQLHADGWIESTLPRERLWLAQTPQVFRADLLRRAHERAVSERAFATDDAALVERLGVHVFVIRGNPENRKITTPEDLRWAEWHLGTKARSQESEVRSQK